MSRRKVGGQLGEIATGKPRQQRVPSPIAKGDDALVNRSIQTTRERWRQLKLYALEHDLKMYETVELILADFFKGKS